MNRMKPKHSDSMHTATYGLVAYAPASRNTPTRIRPVIAGSRHPSPGPMRRHRASHVSPPTAHMIAPVANGKTYSQPLSRSENPRDSTRYVKSQFENM